MERVTGVGGVFFRTADPESLTSWYVEKLGVDPHGGPVIWSPFAEDTDYFGPSGQQLMVNYRVADLDAMLAQLTAAGVAVEGPEDTEYGRFGWAVDPAGNRFELWQPPAA